MPPDHVLAIDQGTTSTRAILFDRAARTVVASPSVSSRSIIRSPAGSSMTPRTSGATRSRSRARRSQERRALDRIAAIGITNQRETVVVWDRSTGEPIHRAIVWQDRRTADVCAPLKAGGPRRGGPARRRACCSIPISRRTKIAWILDHVAGARARAERGRARVRHDRQLPALAADRRRGSRDRRHQRLPHAALRHPRANAGTTTSAASSAFREALLPDVRDNSASVRRDRAGLFDRQIPIARHGGRPAGGADRSGLLRPGHGQVHLRHRLLHADQHGRASRALGQPACSPRPPIGSDGQTTYALEGSIFVAGAAVKWLRDGLGIIADAAETDASPDGSPTATASTWSRRSSA